MRRCLQGVKGGPESALQGNRRAVDTPLGRRYPDVLPERPLDTLFDPQHRRSWWLIAGVVGVQLLLLLLFAVDWRLPVVATGGIVVVTLLLDRPAWAVGALLASRLLSTGTTSFFKIGSMNIGLFEPVLLLGLGALAIRAIFSGKRLWKDWPWKPVFLAVVAWKLIGLTWCTSRSDGLKDIITLGVIFATGTVIIAFVETWEDVKTMLWFWIGTCVFIGLLALVGDKLGLTDYSSQWKAAQGGRETGLGQQPNWYAMNLSFAVHTAAGWALVQKDPRLRWGLLGAALFIFYSMMTSGSRGGAYAIIIAAAIISLGQPIFRKWVMRLGVAGGLAIGLVLITNASMLGSGINRIIENADVLFARDIRGMNWAVCIAMFTDTYGLGIGPGGYIQQLQHYNMWLYESVYRYPHGIFWGELAHGGVVGVILLFALVASVAAMARDTIRYARGTEAEPLAWAMPAAMAGYFSWSFVEFSLDEKPVWEWLALYTALHLVVKRAAQGRGPAVPRWQMSIL